MWPLNHIRELVVSTITVIIKLLSNTPSSVHMLLWLRCLSINNIHAHHYNTHKTLSVVNVDAVMGHYHAMKSLSCDKAVQ